MKIEVCLSYLEDYKNSNSKPYISKIQRYLSKQKHTYVKKNDQKSAKNIWCLEQILLIQNSYEEAFMKMKNANFYEAWCSLERCEIAMKHLKPHYEYEAHNDKYGLKYFDMQVSKFQKLFPYAYFISPEFIHSEKKCSICDQTISIRNSCGHRKGEIYNGEHCVHIITKSEVLATALVKDPDQKYSVPFLTKEDTGESYDHYDYSLIKSIIDVLDSPYEFWDYEWTKIRHPHKFFSHVARKDKCPCGSNKEYRKCCLRKKGVLRPHCQIYLENDKGKKLSTKYLY